MTAIEKTPPVWGKIHECRPDTYGHNLVVQVSGAPGLGTPALPWGPPSALRSPALRCPCCLQVVDAKVVVDKPARGPLKPQKVAECTVGDETGVILLTARNEQGGCCNTST